MALTVSVRALTEAWLALKGWWVFIAVLNAKSGLSLPFLFKPNTDKVGFALNPRLEKPAFDGTTYPLPLISGIDEFWSSVIPTISGADFKFQISPQFFYYKYELGGHIFISNKLFSHATVVLLFNNFDCKFSNFYLLVLANISNKVFSNKVSL